MKGIQESGQAAPSLSLPDLPSAALLAIHNTLLEEDDDGYCVTFKHAASFRSTCKTLHDAVVLPRLLKLSFPLERITSIPSSAAFLSRPAAAGTTLSLQLTESLWAEASRAAKGEGSEDVSADEGKLAKDEGSDADDDMKLDWFDAVPKLKMLGDRLSCLDMTCHQSISDLLLTITEELPCLQHLVLRLCPDAFAKPDFLPKDYSTNALRREEVKIRNNNLRSFVLSLDTAGVHIMHIPFVFGRYDLDLSGFSALDHFVLRGPFVKDAEDCEGADPIIILPHVRVSIDPGVSQDRWTPWARPLTVYERFEAMPRDAIVNEHEFKEMDAQPQKERKLLFSGMVAAEIEKILETKYGPTAPQELEQLTQEMMDDAVLEDITRRSGFEGRSDILLRYVDREPIARFFVDWYSVSAAANSLSRT